MGEQGQRHIAQPGVVAAHLVLVESYLPLGLLKAFLDRPAPAGDPHHLRHRRLRRPKHPVVGQLRWVAHAAAHQQPVGLADRPGVGQRQTRPVVPAGALAAHARREAGPTTRRAGPPPAPPPPARAARPHTRPPLPPPPPTPLLSLPPPPA